MAEIEIVYSGDTIATMNASGTKTLGTAGKYCEDDIEVTYTRPSGGGESNSPICSTTVTIPAEGSTSFDVTLSGTANKYIVFVSPDATTEAAILADTTTQYYVSSIFQMYPVMLFNNDSTKAMNSMMQRYRGSSSTYAVAQVNCVSVSGTTMTISFVSNQGKLFPSGTYNVKVWAVSDS